MLRKLGSFPSFFWNSCFQGLLRVTVGYNWDCFIIFIGEIINWNSTVSRKHFKEDFLSAVDSSPAGEGNLGREIVEKCGSQGGFVFNGVNGVLHIKYGGGGERIYIKGWVCGAMCVKLDAVIDYRAPLSLTGRHMETVTVFRYEYHHQYLPLLSSLPSFLFSFSKIFSFSNFSAPFFPFFPLCFVTPL